MRIATCDRLVCNLDVSLNLFDIVESNHYAASMLRQHKFLSSLLEKLDKPESKEEVSFNVMSDVQYKILE